MAESIAAAGAVSAQMDVPVPTAAHMFDIAVACLVITALAAWFNVRFIRLPNTIGVMAIAMLLSLALLVASKLGFGALYAYEKQFLRSIDFSDVLMQGMLSMLLFAGALHVDVSLLRSYRWQVGVLAVFGTLVSTAIVGFALYLLLPLVGVGLPLGYCLVFGALIAAGAAWYFTRANPFQPAAVAPRVQAPAAPPPAASSKEEDELAAALEEMEAEAAGQQRKAR